MNKSSPALILASRSPRRRELLLDAGYAFEVIPPDDSAECGLCSGENPAQLVARLAYQKAANVAAKVEAGVILGCDTVAECDELSRELPGASAEIEDVGWCVAGKPAHRLLGVERPGALVGLGHGAERGRARLA